MKKYFRIVLNENYLFCSHDSVRFALVFNLLWQDLVKRKQVPTSILLITNICYNFEEGKLPARDFFGVKFLTELSVVAEVLAAACEHVPLKF